MSWDIEAASVLPEEMAKEVLSDFSPEFLAEKLSDYIVELQDTIQELREEVIRLRKIL